MKTQDRHRQGWALPTVLAVLGLCALSALSVSKGVWLHAHLMRGDGDEWRARSAAEALLRDAEQDLLASLATGQDARHTTPATDTAPSSPFIPTTMAGLSLLKKSMPAGLCKDGICAPEALEPPSVKPWGPRLNVAARYGQYTSGSAINASAINPALANDRSGYWLEAFASADRTQNTPLWRITAWAQASPRSAPIVLQAWWQGGSGATTGKAWLSWQEVPP
jgi:Tfp pilus assembly protein PilX